MAKHKLNYTIIREALGEYLNNTNVIPMYNKKQIKEEAYKLEDLENSKAFIIDKAQNKRLKVNCLVSRESLYEVLISCMRANLNPIYLGSGVTFDSTTKTKYDKVEAYVEYADTTQLDRIDDMLWLVREILDSGLIANSITKKQKEQLVIAIENLPNNE
tara:strand:- start:83 stop:559 length:477 start_codon:yes stop_codon:yes gene_type:complete